MTDKHRPRQGSRPIPNEEGLYDDGPASARVPYDERAEEALLGAALLSRKALDVLATKTEVGDFYVPAHRKIAAALMVAFEDGDPADVVTIASWLEDAGQLDQVGGPGRLIELQSSVPATSSAPRYASIVHDKATLRRLLAAAGKISDLGHGDDAHQAVLDAQATLADVASNNGSRSYSTIDVADTASLLAGDLEPEEPTLLTRNDGRSLLYPGKMHMIQAEPESGKTWVGLVGCLEAIRLGGSAVYVDFEDTSRGILGRLLALGATPDELVTGFQYVHPQGAFGMAEKIVLGQILDELNPDLVVIDGVAEALAREGLDEDRAADVTGWVDKFPRWIARTGAAVLLLDHVAKAKDQQGRYARGSSAKLAVLDGCAYTVKTLSTFSRTRAGSLRLIVAKDKPGGVAPRGETAAMVSIDPKADGARVVVELTSDTEARHVSDSWKPTGLMAKVSKELQDSTTPLTAKALARLIHSEKPKFVAEAITRLIAEGYVRETKLGSATVLVLVKPYHHHDDDEPPEPPEPDPTLPLEPDAEVIRIERDYPEEF